MSTQLDYQFRISVGPDYAHLRHVNPNDEHHPIYINSATFTGYILVRILDFNGIAPIDANLHANLISNPASSYFKGKNRKYSMMVQGRFKHQYNGDEIMFGADFDNPIAPPPGIPLGIRIAKWLDPAIDASWVNDTPTMFSPIVSSMNSMAIYKADAMEINTSDEPAIENQEEGEEEIDIAAKNILNSDDSKPFVIGRWSFHSTIVPEKLDLMFANLESKTVTSYEKRKKYFSILANRQAAIIDPEYVYCMDFYDAYFDLNSISVKLPGFSLNAFKFWDGTAKLRYACKTRDGSKVFFVIQYELVKRVKA